MVKIDLTKQALIDAFFKGSDDVLVSELSKIVFLENDVQKAKRVEAGQTVSLDGEDIVINGDIVTEEVKAPKSVKPRIGKK